MDLLIRLIVAVVAFIIAKMVLGLLALSADLVMLFALLIAIGVFVTWTGYSGRFTR